jgi:hypothetical protein
MEMCSHACPDSREAATTYTAAGPCPVPPVLLPPRPGITYVSSMPAARSPQPATNLAKSSEVNTMRGDAGRRTFRGTRPTETRPSSVDLLGACWTTHRRSVHSVTSQPHTPSVAAAVLQTANVRQTPPIVPLITDMELLRLFYLDHPSPHSPMRVGTRSDLALRPEVTFLVVPRSFFPHGSPAAVPPSLVGGILVLASSLTVLAIREGSSNAWDHHGCCAQGTSGWRFGPRTNPSMSLDGTHGDSRQWLFHASPPAGGKRWLTPNTFEPSSDPPNENGFPVALQGQGATGWPPR